MARCDACAPPSHVATAPHQPAPDGGPDASASRLELDEQHSVYGGCLLLGLVAAAGIHRPGSGSTSLTVEDVSPSDEPPVFVVTSDIDCPSSTRHRDGVSVRRRIVASATMLLLCLREICAHPLYIRPEPTRHVRPTQAVLGRSAPSSAKKGIDRAWRAPRSSPLFCAECRPWYDGEGYLHFCVVKHSVEQQVPGFVQCPPDGVQLVGAPQLPSQHCCVQHSAQPPHAVPSSLQPGHPPSPSMHVPLAQSPAQQLFGPPQRSPTAPHGPAGWHALN